MRKPVSSCLGGDGPHRVGEIKSLLDKTIIEQAHMLKLAEAIHELLKSQHKTVIDAISDAPRLSTDMGTSVGLRAPSPIAIR